MDYNSRNLKSNFKTADKLGTKYIIIIGEEEAKSGILTVKNNETKEEEKIKLENIIDYLDRRLEDED